MADRATREAFGETLIELAQENKNVVALDADLAKSTTTIKFKKAYPRFFVECGIAEQCMMDVAAGLAAAGKICYTGSFAIFATGRAFEQVRNTICYSNLNVKVCPTHAGITVGADGSSHQSLEDIALMRAIPNMRVMVPADYYEAKAAIREAAELDGPVYIRLGRAPVPTIFDERCQFKVGSSSKLRQGGDVSILAAGVMVGVSLQAADDLEKKGIEAEVINVSSVKPLDTKGILGSVAKTKAAVTVEEHSIIGGLGSSICELVSEKQPVPVVRVGVRDVFGISGSARGLLQYFGLTSDGIVKAAKKAIAMK